MPNKTLRLTIAFLLFSTLIYSQKKSLTAQLTTENIIIDGKFDEQIWKTAPVASNFVMYQPDNGKPISEDLRTEVKIVYNNDAIYVSAIMYDKNPSQIAKEITKRDVIGNADLFGIFINGNNDGQGDFQFVISASGIQVDNTSTETLDDYSWDAVWDSSVRITDFGWVAELKIPYAAIRFPKSDVQTWGINFYRDIKKTNQQYTWNHIDTNIVAFHTQFGILEGIQNIETPTRLFFIPYSSYYYENNSSGSSNKFKAGLDIKYGISDAFTLDAILVPDFGQTKFDNAILNLTPFEQIYNENRPFFTEGTDLFSKGALLYSRRIGQGSRNQPDISTDEEVTIYPSSINLLNALKISGRTKSGLGIGVLNAITERTFATINNTVTGETRLSEIEPLTNFNLLVLDQRFRKNSSIAFVNSNVSRNGGYRDANVSAIVWDLNTRKNTYSVYGDFKYSFVNTTVDKQGYKSTLGFAKTSGKYRFNTRARYFTKNYDINDLGQNFNTNYFGINPEVSYLIINPTKYFNSFSTALSGNFNYQNTTKKIQDGLINLNINSTLRNIDQLNLNVKYSPYRTFGFYQLRRFDRYAFTPQYFGASLEYITNANKPFSTTINPYFTKFKEEDRITYGAEIIPKYRFNDNFSVNILVGYDKQLNDNGFIDYDGTDFYFARRNNQTINNEITAKYAINNKMTFDLTTRYYWSYTENKQIYTLLDNGLYNNYSSSSTDTKPYDENYNSWNMDLSFTWLFAPASQMTILYRTNAIDDRYEDIDKKLGNNLHNLFKNNLDDIISVSVRYYIDYNVVKNKF